MPRLSTMLTLLLLGCVPRCGEARALARAEAALLAGDLAAAEASYRGVLDDNPDQLDALFGVGWIYHLAQDEDRAREYFKRCVRLAPEDPRGHRGLGSVALAEGNLAQAEQHLQDALQRAPDDARILNSMGLVFLASKRYDAALGWFERAQAADPTRGEYGVNLAEAQLRLGDPEAALATIDASLSGEIEELRFRGLLLELRARVLVAMTSGRVDVNRCAETAPPVLAWLARADRALEQASALELDLPTLPATRRLVHRRRSVVTERCPGVRPPE